MRRRWIPRRIRRGESPLPPRLRPRRIPWDDETAATPAIPNAGHGRPEPGATADGEEAARRDAPRRAEA